jgi:hypothetical protein
LQPPKKVNLEVLASRKIKNVRGILGRFPICMRICFGDAWEVSCMRKKLFWRFSPPKKVKNASWDILEVPDLHENLFWRCVGSFLHTEKVILEVAAFEKSKKCFVGYWGGSQFV